jgi:uroporphyrinogen decarboxylase
VSPPSAEGRPGDDDPFLAACRGGFRGRTPVWFMRQAGRSLPEYRALRGTGSILEAIRHPDLVAEVTLQPVRRYGVDAAILFSDIVVPAAAVGFGVEVKPGVGPVTEHPFSGPADLHRLRPLEPEQDIPYVIDAVRILAAELKVPLIGFAGAPFTVASYLIEGAPSRDYARTKTLMYTDPATWKGLLDRLADMAVASLRTQVAAGARAVQVFDSWAGALSPGDYRRYVLPASRRLLAAIGDLGVPRIHFGVGTGELLAMFAEAGADVVGVDWRVPLADARRRVGEGVAVQGNLDPTAVVAGPDVASAGARAVLASAGGRSGHIFNLGHGVLPQTDPGVLARVVDLVHEETAAR